MGGGGGGGGGRGEGGGGMLCKWPTIDCIISTVLQWCGPCDNERVSEVDVYKLGDNFFLGTHEPPTTEH